MSSAAARPWEQGGHEERARTGSSGRVRLDPSRGRTEPPLSERMVPEAADALSRRNGVPKKARGMRHRTRREMRPRKLLHITGSIASGKPHQQNRAANRCERQAGTAERESSEGKLSRRPGLPRWRSKPAPRAFRPVALSTQFRLFGVGVRGAPNPLHGRSRDSGHQQRLAAEGQPHRRHSRLPSSHSEHTSPRRTIRSEKRTLGRAAENVAPDEIRTNTQLR